MDDTQAKEVPNDQSVQGSKYSSEHKFHINHLCLLAQVLDHKDLQSLGATTRQMFLDLLTFWRWVFSSLQVCTKQVLLLLNDEKARQLSQTYLLRYCLKNKSLQSSHVFLGKIKWRTLWRCQDPLCFGLLSHKQLIENGGSDESSESAWPRSSGTVVLKVCNYSELRRLERVFRCYVVCETKEDYKEGCLMVWANYMSPCYSNVGLYFKVPLTPKFFFFKKNLLVSLISSAKKLSRLIKSLPFYRRLNTQFLCSRQRKVGSGSGC